MGLFGKKSNEIKVFFYEGDLPGFVTYKDCRLILSDDKLYLTQISPHVEVSLDRNRIIDVECLCEQSFMQKYKGNDGKNLQKGKINEGYHVFTYLGKDGENHSFVLYAIGFEDTKMLKVKESVVSSLKPTSYEI